MSDVDRQAPGRSEAAPSPGPDAVVTVLRGVGPARAERLERLGVRTLGELAVLTPRSFERIGPRVEPSDLQQHVGRAVLVAGRVSGVRVVRTGRGRSAVRVRLVGVDGGAGEAVFFNQPWMRDAFELDAEVQLYGIVQAGRSPFLASPRRVDPEGEPLEPGCLVPVYPRVDGLGAPQVRELARRAFELVGAGLPEPIDERRLAELELPSLPEAARELHWPSSEARFDAARRRLALEPLLALQARLQARLAARAQGRARVVALEGPARASILAAFPFDFTPAQATVAAELERDLGRRAPMRRLLQGDVGSGKTALGVFACAAVAAAGHQAAFMAPTELLAEQHHTGQRALLGRLGLRSALLTGNLSAPDRRAVLQALAAGELDVCFGTHALFSEGVEFRDLALAVIDEQHRFGVTQRRRLLDKDVDVHVLLMTATPIPRTLALTLYGDLEVSVLDARPPGRGRIATHRVSSRELSRMVRFVAGRLEAGERVYWVCPRIEDADEGRGVESAHAWLERSPLARHGLELVHGRLPAAERTARLERFRRGESRLLVGTTVIEVGVDVPEATVIVIEGAERFGLAQLHQLRGRVGRGARDSWCFLHGRSSAASRFELLEQSDDGFELAEHDLRARGMGDLVGSRQAGSNSEGLGDEPVDLELLVCARDLMARDAQLRARYLERARGLGRD